MKMFKKSALVLAMTASAGMAHAAGEIDVRTAVLGGGVFASDATGVEVAGTLTGAVTAEALLVAAAAQSADLTAVAPGARSIIYSPNTNISQNSTITFELTNGAIAPNAGAGLPALVGNDGGAPANPVVVGNLIDFTQDADGNYTSLRFQVVTQDLDAANGYQIAYADGTDPTVVVNEGLAVGQNVTIAATSAQDPSAIAIAQGVAPAETVATVVDGIDLDVTVETSTINVEADPSRAEFVANVNSAAAGGDPSANGTLTTLSQSSFTFANSANISFDLSNDSFVLSLTRENLSGVDSVTLVADSAGAGPGPVVQALALDAGVYSIASGNIGGGVNADILETGKHDLEIAVNGTDVLQTGNWLASLVLDTDEVGEVTVANNAVSHIWDINGAQVKIPYHGQNVAGFNFFFKVVNESDNDANVFADVIVENVSQGTRFSKDNVNVGTAVANGSSTIGQAAIKDAINAAGGAGTMNDEDVYHVAMTLTVIAPQNSIQVAAFQKDAVGRTSVPVYVNTNNAADGRRWQQ